MLNTDLLHDGTVLMGCDGENCDDPEGKFAFPVADLPGVAFCTDCMSQHTKRQRRNFCAPQIEKIRRTKPLREEMWS